MKNRRTAPSRSHARAGQSMTSLLVGIAIIGCVGAGAATISRSLNMQEQELSAKSGAALLMDSLADEIRKNTRYSEIAARYDGKTFGDDDGSGSDEFIARASVRKTCNAAPSTNCDRTHVDIEIVDKSTGETVLKQTVTRAYTHYEEPHAFPTLGSLPVPEDTIAIRYTSDSGRGNSGGSRTTYGYDLKINSAACARDYKPNNASPRPNGCVACPAPSGTKQYRSGDCTIGTCQTGQKANAAGNGCEAITCPSGKHLEGDNCVDDVINCSCTCSGPYWDGDNGEYEVGCGGGCKDPSTGMNYIGYMPYGRYKFTVTDQYAGTTYTVIKNFSFDLGRHVCNMMFSYRWVPHNND